MNARRPSARLLPRPRPRRRWLTALVGVGIFLCGAAIGSGVTLLVLRDALMGFLRHPEKIPARITSRLRGKLDLTDEQTTRVESILEKRQVALQELRREVQPRIEAHLDAIRAEIEAVLTKEQAERWREQFDRLRRTWLPPLPPPAETPR